MPKMMVKGFIKENPNTHFWNSLILLNVHMGNFPDSSPEDLPWLRAGGGGGLRLEQFYKVIY